jgi:N-acyl-D-aspartate/D-glutamate deacylase
LFDMIVRAGTVVDGTGAPPLTADVGIRDGRVAEVGRLSERARRREMVALAGALRGTDAVFQLVSDCYQSTDPEYVTSELTLMEAMAEASGRPLSVSVQQPSAVPDRWRELQAWAADCAARGLDVWTQVAPRPIGMLMGLSASINPFSQCPSYKKVAHLDVADRVGILSQPELRSRIIEEHLRLVEQLPESGFARQVMSGFDVMFRLDDPVDYDIRPETSIAAGAARAGADAAGAAYDTLLEDGGHRLIYRFTVKSGEPTFEDGEHTGQLPGRLLRGAQPGAEGRDS